MQTQHELQVIGLIPDMENEITFTIAYEDGTVEEKTVSYEMGSLLGTEKVQLSQEDGESQEALEDGLYVVLGNDSEALDFMYYYDNNGVLRGEVRFLDIAVTGYCLKMTRCITVSRRARWRRLIDLVRLRMYMIWGSINFITTMCLMIMEIF